MAKKIPTLNLPSANDLFSTQKERDDLKREKVLDIPLTEIDDFPDHPFQIKPDEAMQAMIDSIQSVGVQTPAVVRLKEDKRYEMVSGHRRKFACSLAGLDSMPCIVRDMSQDEAVIVMVDSNLQREVILPSEKGKSYKMKLDAIRRQAGRHSNNCDPLGHNLIGKRSREIVAENSPDSNTQIQRYIRLTELIPHLLDMVDGEKIAIRPAVELSYLPSEQQRILADIIKSEERTPSHAQAVKLRKFSEEGRLNNDVILSIMQEDKPNQSEHFRLPKEKIRDFFPTNASAKVIEETIIKALELWSSSNKWN